MADKLTPREDDFAAAIAAGMTQADAYREAYSTENMTNKSIHEEASRVMARRKVSSRVGFLQEALTERTMVTLEGLTKELDQNREMAHATKNAGAMNQSTMGKAKLHGLLVDKVETAPLTVIISGDDADL